MDAGHDLGPCGHGGEGAYVGLVEDDRLLGQLVDVRGFYPFVSVAAEEVPAQGVQGGILLPCLPSFCGGAKIGG